MEKFDNSTAGMSVGVFEDCTESETPLTCLSHVTSLNKSQEVSVSGGSAYLQSSSVCNGNFHFLTFPLYARISRSITHKAGCIWHIPVSIIVYGKYIGI